MKDNLSKILLAMEQLLEEAEEQVRKRQMEERLQTNINEPETVQTDSVDVAE